jgi:hypothetical protein
MVDESPNDLSNHIGRTILDGLVSFCLSIQSGNLVGQFNLQVLTQLPRQSVVTRVIIPFFGAIHAIGLISFSIWFSIERWSFRRSAGIVGEKLFAGSMLMGIIGWFEALFPNEPDNEPDHNNARIRAAGYPRSGLHSDTSLLRHHPFESTSINPAPRRVHIALNIDYSPEIPGSPREIPSGLKSSLLESLVRTSDEAGTGPQVISHTPIPNPPASEEGAVRNEGYFRSHGKGDLQNVDATLRHAFGPTLSPPLTPDDSYALSGDLGVGVSAKGLHSTQKTSEDVYAEHATEGSRDASPNAPERIESLVTHSHRLDSSSLEDSNSKQNAIHIMPPNCSHQLRRAYSLSTLTMHQHVRATNGESSARLHGSSSTKVKVDPDNSRQHFCKY